MPETNPFPTDEELHEMLMEQLLRGIHVAMPGRIQSYDPVHQVADIVIGVKDSYPDPEGDGEYLHVNYPVLPAVPILWPRMGRWFMAMSVEPGDAVQVLFNSSAIGIWRRSPVVDNVEGIDRAMRGVHLVGDVARHHLTHAVALLGLETFGRALNHAPMSGEPASDPEASTVWGSDLADGTRITIYGSGAVKITRGAAVVFQIDADGTNHIGGAEGQAIATAQAVTDVLESLKTAIAGWTPVPKDGGASLKAVISAWAATVTGATKAKAT